MTFGTYEGLTAELGSRYEPADQLMFEMRRGQAFEGDKVPNMDNCEIGLLNTAWPRKAWVSRDLLDEFLATSKHLAELHDDVVQFDLANAKATYKVIVEGRRKLTLYLIEGTREDWPFVKPAKGEA